MLIFADDSIEHDTATKLSELQDSVRLLTALVLAIDSGLRAGIVGVAFPPKPVSVQLRDCRSSKAGTSLFDLL
jgi:hypothetical protein